MSTWLGVTSIAATGTGKISTACGPSISKVRTQYPPVSMVKVMGYTPGDMYMWLVLTALDVLPSPKSHV